MQFYQFLHVFFYLQIVRIACKLSIRFRESLSDGKGIRLDAYVDDENGTIYNIEMQTKVKKELPKRSRYYQGMIDMNLIERGAKYKELKLSFVIFICLKDPFGYHLPVYRFENICVQNRDILLRDEAIKVFINADGDLTGLPEGLAAFLQYLKGKVVENELVQMIDNEVEKVKKHEEWEVEYMTSYLRDMDIREEGIEEGLEQGLSALVTTIKCFTADTEEIYQAVVKNEAYKNTPREEVLKYLK